MGGILSDIPTTITLVKVSRTGERQAHPAYENLREWMCSRIFCGFIPEKSESFRRNLQREIEECGGAADWYSDFSINCMATFDKPEAMVYFLMKWS
jgi:hypothetical protein